MKKFYNIIFSVLLTICISLPSILGQQNIKFFRKDYTYIEATETFYKIHTLPRTWLEAKRTCALEGATFFYPEDEKEFNAVNTFWKETQSFDWVNIGISSQIAKGIFETIDGRLVDDVYNNWYKGEPNNLGGNEDCVFLHKNDGKMNDDSCTKQLPFICKKTLASLEWNVLCDMPNTDYKYNRELGHCYKFYSNPATWTEAHRICRVDQSYLAIVNSEEEAEYLVNITRLSPKGIVKVKEMDSAIFLGFHNKFNDGWTTVKGGTLDNTGYTKWDYRDTDNENKNLCGSMDSSWKLKPVDCNSRAFFVCEHDTPRNKIWPMQATIPTDIN